jgi:hypothetical protein
MKKMIFTSFTKLMFTLLALVAINVNLSAQCGPEKIDISLGNCTVGLTAADFPGATITGNITVRKPGGIQVYSGPLPTPVNSSGNNIFGRADVAQEFEVMYMSNGSMCFTFVRVFDRTAPVATIVANPSYIRCNELQNGKVPLPGTVISQVGPGSTPDAATRIPEPILGSVPTGVTMSRVNPMWASSGNNAVVFATVTDCHSFTASYTDADPVATTVAGACSAQLIVRNWIFKDIYGNPTATIAQNIIVITPALVLTPTVNLSCVGNSDVSTAGLPGIDWNLNGTVQAGEVITSGVDYCGSSATLIGSPTAMNTCGSSRMITRTWKVIRCGVIDPTPFVQTINVMDDITPRIGIQYNNYPRTPIQQTVCMGDMRITEFVYTLLKDLPNEPAAISAQAGDGNYVNNPNQAFNSSIRILPVMDDGTCDRVTLGSRLNRVRIGLFEDNCNSYPITVTASPLTNGTGAIRFDGMPSMTVTSAADYTINLTGTVVATTPGVDPFFILSATDACGNTTKIKVTVVVIDNLSPTPFCNGTEITLNNGGSAMITAAAISANSADNCGVTRRLVRRMTTGNTECWTESLVLGCQDIGRLMVESRVIDMMGNYNDCMVEIVVRDKQGPTCPMMPPVTTVCTNPALSNIESFFTQPTAFDNCETPSVVANAPVLNLSCGAGTVDKTWTFSDRAGNSVTCTQRLTVTPVAGFRVTALRSTNPTCGADIPTIDAEKATILASIKNLRRNANNTADEVTCSAPVLKITEELYMSTDFCKRLIRTYELVDLCVAPNVTCLPANTRDLGVVASDATAASITDVEVGGFTGRCKITWKRYITVLDNTPPVPSPVAVREICIPDPAACTIDLPNTTLTARDQCGSLVVSQFAYLFYRWDLVSPAGAVIASGNGSGEGATNAYVIRAADYAGLRGLAVGIYTIRFTVIDDCGNIATGSTTVTIKECKTPYINTHDKNTALAAVVGQPGQGMSRVCIDELLNDWNDNCTDKEKVRRSMRLVRAIGNAGYPATPSDCVMFGCSDIGVVQLRLWAADESGNQVFNLIDITVQDNNRACSSAVPQSIVTGSMTTEQNQPAKNVTLTANMAGTIAAEVATSATGTFEMSVNQTGNYVLKASKQLTDDKYTGVTTFDIAVISKHILDIQNFTSPYQAIAADVNKDGVIDAIDMVTIRNFILRKIPSLPGGVWRFVDKSYQFRNPANPFGEDFPEVINIANAKANEVANFVAVKLGDPNGNFAANLAPTTTRNEKSLVLNVEDMQLVAGNEYTVNVSAKDFNAASFQGTFSIAGATIKSVKAGDLANYSDGNFALFANEFTTSWNGKASANADVFTVSFVANKSAKLSEVMTVGSNLTPAVANDAQGTEMNVSLKFNTGKVQGGEFALHAATPNPVSFETNIGFVMPKDGAAKMTIYTVDGKVVAVKNIDAKAGLNNVIVTKSELNASGVMYYRLETADHSATKKMVVIE